jgi:hypothetical protein
MGELAWQDDGRRDRNCDALSSVRLCRALAVVSAFVVGCNDRPVPAPPAHAPVQRADGDARVQRAVNCEREAEQVANFMLGKKPPEPSLRRWPAS